MCAEQDLNRWRQFVTSEATIQIVRFDRPEEGRNKSCSAHKEKGSCHIIDNSKDICYYNIKHI